MLDGEWRGRWRAAAPPLVRFVLSLYSAELIRPAKNHALSRASAKRWTAFFKPCCIFASAGTDNAADSRARRSLHLLPRSSCVARFKRAFVKFTRACARTECFRDEDVVNSTRTDSSFLNLSFRLSPFAFRFPHPCDQKRSILLIEPRRKLSVF